MASIDLLMNEVRREVMGCPEFAIRYACQRAMREFCRETFFYQRTIGINLLAGLSVYPLESSDYPDEELLHVVAVQYNGQAVRAVDPMVMPEYTSYPATSENQTRNYISAFAFEPPHSLVLFPIANVDETSAVLVRGVFQTSTNTQSIPDILQNSYLSAIAANAVAYLCSQLNVDWSNQAKSQEKYREYWIGAVDAKRQRSAGMVVANVGVKPRRFLI